MNQNIQYRNKKNTHVPKAAKRVFRNLSRWSIQMVLFSLIPLALYLLVHWMFQIKEDMSHRCISEISTFTLVISSSTAMELAKKKYKDSGIKEIVFPAFLVLLIIFVAIYGVISFSFEINVPIKQEVLDNMYLAVLVIGVVHFVIALLLQVIGGIQGD